MLSLAIIPSELETGGAQHFLVFAYSPECFK
jgi:hypothetical protein